METTINGIKYIEFLCPAVRQKTVDKIERNAKATSSIIRGTVQVIKGGFLTRTTIIISVLVPETACERFSQCFTDD